MSTTLCYFALHLLFTLSYRYRSRLFAHFLVILRQENLIPVLLFIKKSILLIVKNEEVLFIENNVFMFSGHVLS